MSQSVRRRPVRRRSAAPSSTQTTAVRTPAGQPARTALLLATATAMLSAGTALPAQAAEETIAALGGTVAEQGGQALTAEDLARLAMAPGSSSLEKHADGTAIGLLL